MSPKVSVPKVSVIVPALDEEPNLAEAVKNIAQALDSHRIPGEIIVVDDGSTDGTPRVISRLEQKIPNLRALRHEEPLGLGRSFWDGVKIARGELVTLIPGDGENDANEILRHIPLTERYDLVVPYVANTQVRGWKRRLLSEGYRRVVNASFGTSLKYTNGTVLYRKSVLDQLDLRSSGFFYQTELLVKCLRRGCRYIEVPYALKPRASGESKALRLKSLAKLGAEYALTLAETRLFAR